jgi:hypothetical protein
LEVAVLEILTFRLRSGVDGEAFRLADIAAQESFFYAHAGMQRRTTACAQDGEWLVITNWATEEDGDAAERSSRFPQDFADVAAMVELSSINRKRFF